MDLTIIYKQGLQPARTTLFE